MEVEPIFQTYEFSVIKTKQKGKCVIANKNFKAGDTLFINNYLVVPKNEVEGKKLTDHYFWSHLGKNDDNAHIVFGLGTFLNHSSYPNAFIKWDVKKEIAVFSATRDIKKGEEVTLDYEEIWFNNLFEPITLSLCS